MIKSNNPLTIRSIMSSPDMPENFQPKPAGENPTRDAELAPEMSRIIESGNFDEIKRMIGRKLYFQAKIEHTIDTIEANEISRLKEKYQQDYELGGFFDRKDLEALALLKLLHQESFEHSVKTLDELLRAIKRIHLADGRSLDEVIAAEFPEHNLRILVKATLLHDVGKLEIPKFVTDNTLKPDDWKRLFLGLSFEDQRKQLLNYARWRGQAVPEEALADQEALLGYVETNHVRFVQLVPFKYGISEKDRIELERRGFSPEMTLAQIMGEHEPRSGTIIRAIGEGSPDYDLTARLAENHHRGNAELNRDYPAAATSLVMSHDSAWLHELLTLADIKSSTESRNRGYRQGSTSFGERYNEIQSKIKEGCLTPYFVALWLEYELAEMDQMKKSLPEKNEATPSLPTEEEIRVVHAWIVMQKLAAEKPQNS